MCWGNPLSDCSGTVFSLLLALWSHNFCILKGLKPALIMRSCFFPVQETPNFLKELNPESFFIGLRFLLFSGEAVIDYVNIFSVHVVKYLLIF